MKSASGADAMHSALVRPNNDFTIIMRWVDGRLVGELEIDTMGHGKITDTLYQVRLQLVPVFGGKTLTASFGHPPQALPPISAAPAAETSPAAGGLPR